MKKILDYLKITAVLIAVLVGVQAPTFIDQYGKNLNSRLSESSNSIAEFQYDADEYFNGDLNSLIAHYKIKQDPVIISGGESIEALLSRNQTLLKAQTKFKQSVYSAYTHVFFGPVEEVRVDVWQNYSYSIILNKSAIIAAVISCLSILMLFELGIFLLFLITKTYRKPRKLKPVTDSPSQEA